MKDEREKDCGVYNYCNNVDEREPKNNNNDNKKNNKKNRYVWMI